MKKLILFRHTKAVPDDVMADDHARPLAARGREAAELMGVFMNEKGIGAQRVLCSTAQRTRETLELAAAAWEKAPGYVEHLKDLYLAPPLKILAMVHQQPDEAESLMIVGHNPGLHMLAVELAGSGRDNLLAKLNEHFPTGAMAEITFNVESWGELLPRTGHVTHFATPRLISPQVD
jgi:phosphohistidine phosphatase